MRSVSSGKRSCCDLSEFESSFQLPLWEFHNIYIYVCNVHIYIYIYPHTLHVPPPEVLGAVVQAADPKGRSYPRYLEEELFIPLGLRSCSIGGIPQAFVV